MFQFKIVCGHFAAGKSARTTYVRYQVALGAVSARALSAETFHERKVQP
jgi:hypothetical protein